jgi:hypothetical protein
LGGGKVQLPSLLERAVEVYTGERTCGSYLSLGSFSRF